MMYPYIILGDETEISHSHLMKKNGTQEIEVHFERPVSTGFDSARCKLPSYQWTFRNGFSDEEISTFTKLLRSNAHLLYKYAKSGGVQIL